MKMMTAALAVFLIMTGSALAEPPTGYVRTEYSTDVAENGALATNSFGVLYFSHDSDGVMDPGYGMSDAVYRMDEFSGTAELVADGFGSISSIAIDDSGMIPVFYIADNNPLEESFPDGEGYIVRLEDINEDDDFDDVGEWIEFIAIDAMDNIQDICLCPESAHVKIFATNSTCAGGANIYVLEDLNDDHDCKDTGELQAYAMDLESLYACMGGVVVDNADPNVIYANDSGGYVYRLEDVNDDRDCIDDPGEITTLTSALGGGYDITQDIEGDLFVSSVDWFVTPRVAAVYQVDKNTGDHVLFDDLYPAAEGVSSLCFKYGDRPYEPHAQNGDILYLAYYAPDWYPPDSVMAYATDEIQTPALSFIGIFLLLAGFPLLMIRKKRRRK